METQNLWPDFAINKIKSPKAILKEQAGHLMAQTNNVLSAEVRTSHYNGNISHDFIVIAPAIDNYRYSLFSVKHAVTGYYPITINIDSDDPAWEYGIEAENEKEFVKLLSIVFNNPAIIQIVSSLLSQSLAE